MLQTLRQKNVEIWFRDTASGDRASWLLNIAPLLLLAALWFFMMRQMKSREAQRETAGARSGDNSWLNK